MICGAKTNIFHKIFGRVKKSIYEMQSRNTEVGSQVDKIAVRFMKRMAY